MYKFSSLFSLNKNRIELTYKSEASLDYLYDILHKNVSKNYPHYYVSRQKIYKNSPHFHKKKT